MNDRIRAGRVESGEVDDALTATGSDDLPIGAGDLIQTRRNDTGLGVANRQQWIVQQVTDDGTVYAQEVASGRRTPRTVALPAEYVSEHAHLSYAATAYGVQGATVNSSHTVLTEATSAAGVYVGMTRGRETNRLHVVAENMTDARVQFIDAMERDRADRGLDHATAQAVDAVRGIIKSGPVQRVSEELARLDREAERAKQQAERWEQTADQIDAQRGTHRAEDDESSAMLRRAEEEAARVRAEVAGPLTKQAESDGEAYLAAVETEIAASARLTATGRFGKRKARDTHRSATEQARTARASLRATWGDLPRTPEALPTWVATAAARRAEIDSRVSDAERAVKTAHAGQEATQRRHKQERMAMLVSELGADQARRDGFGMRPVNPHRNAHDAHTRAALARAEADELRSLPVNDAAQRIEAKRAEQEQARRQLAQRARQLDPFERDAPRTDPGRDGPARDL